jgi:hypothetical protein
MGRAGARASGRPVLLVRSPAARAAVDLIAGMISTSG